MQDTSPNEHLNSPCDQLTDTTSTRARKCRDARLRASVWSAGLGFIFPIAQVFGL